MFRLDKGGLRIFRLLGVDVFVHWSWALVGFITLFQRAAEYGSQVWNVLEYLTLFFIVLLHEFGHALACRSVGGTADRIMLWPLGGVAYVAPPPRPGANLWSIAAGPLVNVVLVPVTVVLVIVARSQGASANLQHYVFMVAAANAVLLLYNILPIYPLDGGQMLQSILWYFLGRARSLMVATVIGMAGAIAIFVFAIVYGHQWFIYLALFNAYRCYTGFQAARAMYKLYSAPRHVLSHCPECQASPPQGPFWKCSCGAEFDVFAGAGCPRCRSPVGHIACPDCRVSSDAELWRGPAVAAAGGVTR